MAKKYLFFDTVTGGFKADAGPESGGGGSVAHPGASVAFVYPATGNDSTGDGTQAAPFATLQKAVDEGATTIIMGAGNVGGLSLSSSKNLALLGMGSATVINDNVAGNGHQVYLRDIGRHSFKIEATGISSTDIATPGSMGGVVILEGVWAVVTTISANGAPHTEESMNGGQGGSVSLRRGCRILASNVYAQGGASSFGYGGNGGSTEVEPGAEVEIQGTINADAGSGGWGTGSNGTLAIRGAVITGYGTIGGSYTDLVGGGMVGTLYNGAWISG